MEKSKMKKVKFCDNTTINNNLQNNKNVYKPKVKRSRKNENYPDCKKDDLLKAMDKVDLPFWDEIMKHELNIVQVDKWEVNIPSKPIFIETKRKFNRNRKESILNSTQIIDNEDNPINYEQNMHFDSSNLENTVINKTLRPSILKKSKISTSTLGEKSIKRPNVTIDDKCSNDKNDEIDENTMQLNYSVGDLLNNEKSVEFRSDNLENNVSNKTPGASVLKKQINNKASTPKQNRFNKTKNVSITNLSIIRSPEDISDSPVRTPLRTVTNKHLKHSESIPVRFKRPSLKDSPLKIKSSTPINSNRKVKSPKLSHSRIVPTTLIEIAVEETNLDVRKELDELNDKSYEDVNKSLEHENESSDENTSEEISTLNKNKSWNVVNRNGSSLFKPKAEKLNKLENDNEPGYSFCVNKTILDCNEFKKPNMSTKSKRKSLMRTVVLKDDEINRISNKFVTPNLKNKKSLMDQNFSILSENIKTDQEIRDLVNGSFVAAFSSAKLVYHSGKQKQLTAKEKVFLLCSPSNITKFEHLFSTNELNSCKKIGEGSYGEVFKLRKTNETEAIVKIIALFPTDNQSEDEIYKQIIPELMMSNSLSNLRHGDRNQTNNFINLINASCVKDKYPNKLIKEWKEYENKNGSENNNPKDYDSNQIYLVMFLGNGGEDLEKFNLKSASEALSIFYQLTFSLAIAEIEFEFEHRDLHWSNVLVMNTEESNLTYKMNGKSFQIETNKVMVSIIDFSLSRMKKDGFIVYDDLEKYEEIFNGEDDYQFDIYRLMRKNNGKDWEKFSPKSNVFWLHYIVTKLIENKKYSSRSKQHLKAIKKLKDIRKGLLNFTCAQEVVNALNLGGGEVL